MQLVARLVVTGLIEGDQDSEVLAGFLVEAAGFGKALSHRLGEVAFAVDHQLQVVGSAQPRIASEAAIGKPFFFFAA